jgi:hypothetical protein
LQPPQRSALAKRRGGLVAGGGQPSSTQPTK